MQYYIIKKEEMEEAKIRNEKAGRNVDIEYDRYIKEDWLTPEIASEHVQSDYLKICVCVRKRPIFKKEENAGDIDCVSVANPHCRVHEPKIKVDGITKYVENHDFNFDNSFNESEPTEPLYKTMLKPLITSLFTNGIVTCFAYGQTGSGKTFTMKGVQDEAIQDILNHGQSSYSNLNPIYYQHYVSFFEIYRGRVFDLLNSREKLEIMEDHNNEIQIQGLQEVLVSSESELQEYINLGNSIRTTHSTSANDESSRSHAVCQITIKNGKSGEQIGKLKLVDLAGSERAQDTQSNNRQRRLEGADINKSLLALKECIRAFDTKRSTAGEIHVPFRASKLTMILRDSFNSKNELAKIVMIACINPGSSSADHTLNTLRYAGRLKASFDKPSSASEKLRQYAQLRKQDNDPIYKSDPSFSNMKPPLSNQISGGGISSIPASNVVPPVVGINKRNSRDLNHGRVGMSGVGRLIMGGNGGSTRSLSRDVNEVKVEEMLRNSHSREGKPIKSKKERDASQSKRNHTNQSSNMLKVPNSTASSKKKDIDYLRQTLRGNENMYESEQMLDFAEKVDNLIEEEEEVVASHLICIKEQSKLLQMEGNLLVKAQQSENDEEDMDDYVEELEIILKRRRELDEMLLEKVRSLKSKMKEEEEAHMNATQNFGKFEK